MHHFGLRNRILRSESSLLLSHLFNSGKRWLNQQHHHHHHLNHQSNNRQDLDLLHQESDPILNYLDSLPLELTEQLQELGDGKVQS